MKRVTEGVYALRYAYRTESERGEHFYGHDSDCHGTYPIDYYIWAICRDTDIVLVDTGFTPETAARRGARVYLHDPATLLKMLGRTADEVSHVILTHLHYDHTGNLGQFPNATAYVQQSELDFWLGPLAERGSYPHLVEPADLQHIAARATDGRLKLVDGDWALDDSISAHLVGGHTPGLQVVRVATPHGPVVIAADASHFYENIESDRPYGIVHELPAMYAAFDRLHELAGRSGVIVPGHDPLLRERHRALDGLEDVAFSLEPEVHRKWGQDK